MGIIIAAAIVAGIGLICSVALVLAAKFMHVESDEKFTKIREVLPGANCGACGFSGCDGYANALAKGETEKTNLCVPGAGQVSKQLSEILGTAFEDVTKKVAAVRCAGDCTKANKPTEYDGISTCAARALLPVAKDACGFGCIGLGDCANACPEGAICVESGIARINVEKCIGCGICEKTCPRSVIELINADARVIVSCSNREKGAVVRAECKAGCISCKKCEKTCAVGAIKVENDLARIDQSICVKCGECAAVCPVGAIDLLK